MLRNSVPSISRILSSGLVILLIPDVFACGRQVVYMFRFSFANDLAEVLDRVATRSTSNMHFSRSHIGLELRVNWMWVFYDFR